MAGPQDWFQREERIGHISDIRVHNLQVERVRTQKRTFTRWINFHLNRCKPPLEVKDLFEDMQDGKVLMALLEVLSGHRLMHHYKQSTHRIFRLNNIARALKFLEDGYVKLVSIDAPEIADGNPSLILGLIWNIILHFQIKEAAGHLAIFSPTASLSSLHNGGNARLPGDPASPRATAPMVPAKDQGKVIKALLKWVQRRTAKYGVAVQDFGSSWRSGVAFLALIKAIKPSLVDMEEAMVRPSHVNLQDAFKIAADNLDIPPLLEPEDVDVERPEEQSITTYVSQFLEHFPDMDKDLLGGTCEPPLGNPHSNSAATPSDRAVGETYRGQEMEGEDVVNNGTSSPWRPQEAVHSPVSNEVFGEATNPSAIPRPNTPSPQGREHPPLPAPRRFVPPSPESTEAVEEIYVVLHPVRRRSSMGEKILVLEKDPSCLISPLAGSPGSANGGVVAGESPPPSGQGPSAPCRDVPTDEAGTLSSGSHHRARAPLPESPCPEAPPARQRAVSESCTQTEGKHSSDQQRNLFHPAFLNEDKLSVIPLSLVYYPHYNVPVSQLLDAFAVTADGRDPGDDIDTGVHRDEELSPLTDEAYQSCSELGSAFSLQGLSPTVSDYTLYTPDSDGAGPWSDAGVDTQPGTETSECVSAARACAPLHSPAVSREQPVLHGENSRWEEKPSVPKDGDPQQSQGDGRQDEEERPGDPEEVEGQRWDLQSSTAGSGTEGTGEGTHRPVSEDGWAFDASFQQPAVLLGTGTSSSTATSKAEDVGIANSRDLQGSEEDCLATLADEHHVSSWQEEVEKQDGVELWQEPGQLQEEHFQDAGPPTWTNEQEAPHKDEHHVSSWQEEVEKQDGVEFWQEPGQLLEEHFQDAGPPTWTNEQEAPHKDEHHVSSWQEEVEKQDGMEFWQEPGQLQEEHFQDADPPTWTNEQEAPHKFTDCLPMLNEPQTTEQTCLRSRSTLQSQGPRLSTFGCDGAGVDQRGEMAPGSPQLPYTIIILWMVVYGVIVLLHLDLESLGHLFSS
ncbi:uncharacterized protein LOC144597496 isoform X2 [Rhinoraja longicauda]